MAEATSDDVSVNIVNMLNSWSSSPLESSIFRVGDDFPSIFKVDDNLRNIKPEAYDPKIIAIGPFHRNKPHLMKIEQIKVWYLKRLLLRTSQCVEIYVEEIRRLKDEAWKCYVGEIGRRENKFLQMLLLDGCFIIEFLRKFQHPECRDGDDPIFQYEHIQNQLMHDLMLFENQIPFFVIDCLFNMIEGDSRYTIINSIIWPLLQNGIFPVLDPPPKVPKSPHLLGIVHYIQCYSFAEKLSAESTDANSSSEDGIWNKCWWSAGNSENGSVDMRNECSSSAEKSSQTDSKNGSDDPGNGTNDEMRNECRSSTEKASQSDWENDSDDATREFVSRLHLQGSHLKLDPGNSTNDDEIRNGCWSSDQTDPELNDSSADGREELPKMEPRSTRRPFPGEGEILTRGTTTNDKVNIDSATELKKWGISFKRSKVTSLFHIEFNNKAMSIPVWRISDSTESSFRNLIAYEYYQRGNPRQYVTDYVVFMRCLVHSPKDAKLLRLRGIISNHLGGDEMVYQVINNLGKDIIASEVFSYSDVFSKVKEHCGRKWNQRMATLRRDYFGSPWAFISVLAASILLVLTVTQTVLHIFSYRNDLNKDN